MVLKIILILIVLSILYKLFYENYKGVKLYEEAQKSANKQNRQLLVLGSPTSLSGKFIKLFTNTYGCGDICIDMNGCEGCSKSIAKKVEDVLYKYESNKYVIFESGLLEVVDKDKLEYIIQEMYRLAGKKENIYGRHYIQNNKPYYKYFGKYLYNIIGEGTIERFVDEYPPNNNYKFDNNVN